jgi:SAM-dependent methyltransferase/uncharacterized protein YbaR (Trm112 family)
LRLKHFQSFSPICPVCVRAGRAPAPLIIATVSARSDAEILEGILHCPGCQHEYPVLDGIPIIVPELAKLLGERGIELLLRDDLDPMLESLFGDAIGPESWFDVSRQLQSTYAWDAYADLDPDEERISGGPESGAIRRCLGQILGLDEAENTIRRVLDIGCAAGRSSFDLATAHSNALVLGIDLQLALLRIAQRAAGGHVSYPRRRIGLVYDRRRFAVELPDADRVDFWACDATALPFPVASADLCVGLNLLDCVPDPRQFLVGLAAVTAPGGRIFLATPYDWTTRATPLPHWLGGHSQRAAHGGAGEAFLHGLVDGGGANAVAGLRCVAEQAAWPWQTRLHARSSVQYSTHLLVLRRD